jgi:AraC-like DNA-binding protein
MWLETALENQNNESLKSGMSPMLYTKSAETLSSDAETPETFPDNNYFAYFCPTPRPFPLFVCGHYPAGIVAPPHSHPYLALHGCMQGPLTLQTEVGDQRLNEGDFFLIPPGLRHNWKNEGSYTGAVLALLIDTNSTGIWAPETGVDTCCRGLARHTTRLHRFSVAGDTELQRSFWLAADQLTAEDNSEPVVTTGVLLTLIGQVHERLAASPRANTPATDVAREIHRFLQNHVQDRLDLPQIASAVGVSPTRAKRAFHDAYGCGIMAYFNHLKIQQAKRLLCDSSMTIENVSDRLSFANPAYFSRVFTHLAGVSPSNFRRSTGFS